MRHWFFIFILGLATLVASCAARKVSPPPPATPATPTQQVFQVKGTIVELLPAENSIRIQHEAIPDYMPAMTMPFEVKNTNEMTGLVAGDVINFRLTVTEKEGWIDQIKKVSVSAPPKNPVPTTGPFRFVRDVEPLNIGDPLPDYRFTNQFGQAVNLGQFRGQALVFTFIFTRCPFPNFCPLMSNNFREAQDTLLKMSNAPTNWHLFTISFDPEWDKPGRLKAYAVGMKYNPRYWSFLTGDLVEITAIAEQVGEVFVREPGSDSINHNFRTVVVDAQGRVQKIIAENKWTPAELVEEILKAARAAP